MYRARFRLVSPLRVDCLLQPGIEFREEVRTYRFWDSVAAEFGATVLRRPLEQGRLEYETARSIDLPNDISVLKRNVAVDPGFYHSVDPQLDVESLTWSLCDFGILLVEMTLSVAVGDQSASMVEQKVQRVATTVNEKIVAQDYSVLREVIRQKTDHSEFVLFEDGAQLEPAWASRALIYSPKIHDYSERQRVFAVEWLGGGEREEDIVEKLSSGKLTHYADWMNYVYVAQIPENTTQMQENWKALLRAQFYYAAMARIDSKLMRILSWAMSNSNEISTKKLREQLRREMDFAEALFLKKSEIGKYVNPVSRSESERILNVWNFDEVLADPVKNKLEICQTRLDNIESERSRSASFLTDLILMVIGVTSILGTALAVVSLGRSASADPDQTVYDLGAGDLTTWIATQPIDVILLISTIVSVLMIAAFVMARRWSES